MFVMFKNSLIYLGSSLFNKLTPFLLLPILTLYLSPAEYGTIVIFQLLITFYLSLFGGLNINIPRTYFSLKKNEFSSYLKALYVVLCLVFISSTLLSIIYLAFDGPTFGLEEYWLLAMPLIAALSMANLLNLTLMRTQGKPLHFAGWEISHALINLLLSMLFVVVIILGWQGRILGIVLPLAAFGLLGFFSIKQKGLLSQPWNKSDVKQTILISGPLIPHAIASVALTSADLILIEKMIGSDAVGIYSVGYQFGMVIMLFTDAFLKAWQPWFFKKMAVNNATQKQEIVKATYCYIIGLCLFALIYGVIMAEILPFFIKSNYHGATEIILPVCIGYVFFGIYQMFFPYLVHLKKTKMLMFITPFSALLNICLNIYLIPIYGMLGAAYATIFSYAISSLLVFYFANKYHPMPWFGQKSL